LDRCACSQKPIGLPFLKTRLGGFPNLQAGFPETIPRKQIVARHLPRLAVEGLEVPPG
jgi:hypothetical protein